MASADPRPPFRHVSVAEAHPGRGGYAGRLATIRSEGPADFLRARRPRILIVDDDENILLLLQRYLLQLEADVDLCDSSRAALNLLGEKSYDLALLDIMMPDSDGITLCRSIKSNPRTRDCSVIFMTALEGGERLEDAFEAGGLEYLQKPIQRQELIARTKAALKLKATLDELHRSHANLQAALFKTKVKHNEARHALSELKEVQRTVLFSMAKLAESRDNETGRHLLRVQRYVELLARALQKKHRYRGQITRAWIENLVISAPLHDIGKVGIPDAILLKPGKLTPSEFEVMKQHAAIGGNTLREAARGLVHTVFLDLAIEIASYHHEKHDGTGYPEGLGGESIPLAARIMSLADNYDALRSRRVYKEPYDHSRTVDIIVVERGEFFFHPDVLAAFRENQDEFERVSLELKDE